MAPTQLVSLDALRFAAKMLKGRWPRIIVFGLLPIAMLEAGVIVATRVAASHMVGTDPAPEVPTLIDASFTVTLLAMVLLFMALRTAGVTALWALLLRKVTKGSVKLSTGLFTSYLHWPYAELMGHDRARMFENMRTASRAVSQDVVTPMLMLLSELIVATAVVVVLLVLAPLPTLFIIGWFALIFGFLLRLVSKKSRCLARQKWQAFRALQELDHWTFRQFRNVRLMGQETELAQRHHALSQISSSVTARLFLLLGLNRHIGEMALLGSMTILFGWFTFAGHAPERIIQELAILSVASLRLLPVGQRAVALAHQIQQALPMLKDMLDDLAAPTITLNSPRDGNQDGPVFHNTLSLNGVSFAYGNGHAVVPKETCLFLRCGEWLHVCGPSGAGKTTLVALLLGLLRPSQGTVSVDGRSVDMLHVLRSRAAAMVPQDASIVTGTIRENIAFPFSPESVDAATAASLLKRLGVERQLDDRVGDEGTTLSGGEKQKIAIIRALLLQPEVLVLDEATSQIDPAGEHTVFSLIKEHLPTATVLVIAHKLGTDIPFDRLWVREKDGWSNLQAKSHPPHLDQAQERLSYAKRT